MIGACFDRRPGMQVTSSKQILRPVANASLDVTMQTQGMSDEQALDLMRKQTFQERQEAVAKVKRAKLTSCQLPTYFAGWQGWLSLRSEWEQKHGAKDIQRFHELALKEGALPMPAVS